jgi:hypothetical protein
VQVYGGNTNVQTVTIENVFVYNPEGTDVYLFKLNCETDPGPLSAFQVAQGNFPPYCALVPGVEFTIKDANGTVLETVVTNAQGEAVYRVISTTSTILVTENAATNPLAIPPTGDFQFDDIHCPCGSSDIVIVNLLAPTPTATPEP